MPVSSLRAAVPALALVFAPIIARAQDTYKQPPAPIAQILDAAPTPAVSVSPDRAWLLLLERNNLPPVAEVAAPELRLAGLRINPRTNTGSRDVSFRALRLRSVTGNTERRIETPAGARIGSVMWSDGASRIAFTVGNDTAVALWVADVATGRARQVTGARLNGTTGAPCDWLDATRLVCKTIPAGRGAPPDAPAAPSGPVIQQSQGRAAPVRTYQDLLRNAHDEALFEHYLTSQVALVTLDGAMTPVGKLGIHAGVTPSPDGRYLLVNTVHRPFSYVVPIGDFPLRTEVWDLTGAVVRQIADSPLQDEVGTQFDAVQPGPRGAQWRADAPATVVWVEALDEGKPGKEAAKRDRLLMLAEPFTGQPVALLDADTRIRGVQWVPAAGANQGGSLALVTEGWWRTRRTKTTAVDPANLGSARVIFDRSSEDRYNDPGSFATTVGLLGTRVVLTSRDGRSAYLSGQGASPQGDTPFLDRIDLATGKTTRLWRSAAPYYEEVVAVLDPGAERVLTRRESVRDVPNYFVRDVRRNSTARLTSFADPAPQFAGVTPQLITYKRADGVQLSGTLYLPPGYDRSKGPLPFVFWAYPREFQSAAAAAQVQGSPYRFVRPSGASHLFALTQGYGVLDNPTMPIIGEGVKANDTYVEQLVSSAQAAVDKVVEMGVADRDRIGIGGHSYGAFMTANLLAHSDLFRAGIARSGAYNRTLTPFGFQAEERPFWQARDIYMRMSPFNYADKINEPILLIHGEADDNSGTFPIQSERMYAALKGNGATVRYVVLPAEAHGYRARESVGHALWEMVTWLDSYVKNAAKQRAAR